MHRKKKASSVGEYEDLLLNGALLFLEFKEFSFACNVLLTLLEQFALVSRPLDADILSELRQFLSYNCAYSYDSGRRRASLRHL